MIQSLRAIVRVIRGGRPPIGWAISAAASLAFVAAINVLPPMFTGRIIDALQHGNATATMRQLGAYVLVTILAAVLGFFNSYATSTFRESIARNLRVSLMEKLLRARLCALERLSFGEVANRLSDDLDGLCYKFEYSLFPTVQAACVLIATLTAMFAIDKRFAAISCVAVAISVLPSRLVAARFTSLQRNEAGNHDRRASAVSENATVAALALLRHPRAAARQLARYAALADEARSIRLGSAATSGIASVLTTLINLTGPAAVLALGAVLLLHHASTVGTIVTFLLFQSRLYGPFSSLSTLPLQITGCGVLAQRVLEIADMEEESSGNAAFGGGDIAIASISVVKSERTIVDDAHLTIENGTHVALVGPSGAGKSTIGSLLLRLHDPSRGTIRVGGLELPAFDLRSLREAVVLVPQDPLVFDTTLRDNLTYLNPTASDDDVEGAVDACALREVIDRLPERYETHLGQRGFRLSGGERQRVCVARALIARPQTIVLDEALTGVDVEAEARILDRLRELYQGRTLIVVTHRLHSIVNFDRIFVIEDGRVTASGSHAQATAASPWYRDASATARLFREPVLL